MNGKNDSQTRVEIPEWIESSYKDLIKKSTQRVGGLQDALWAKMMPGNTAGSAPTRSGPPQRGGDEVWDELIRMQNARGDNAARNR